MAKQRESNLELYRILVMLSIVAHHYVVNSGLLDEMSQDPTSWRSLYFYVFGAWGKVGINCFVLITGYFMCKSHITPHKFLKLLLEVIFYMFFINLIQIIMGVEKLTLISIRSNIQILLDVSSCFTSCFLMFYLFIPFLNILLLHMTQRQHLSLLSLCLIIYTGISTFMLGKVEMNYVVWFCILYLISSYIRLYQPMSSLRWDWILGGVFLLSVLSIVAVVFLGDYVGKDLPQYHFVNGPNKLLALLLSVSLFMFFKDLHIPHSGTINRLAQSCFGVLLIHAQNDAMRQWLWKDFLDVKSQLYADSFILHSVLSVLGIYIACTIIDQMRIEFFEKPLFGWIENTQRFKTLWQNH